MSRARLGPVPSRGKGLVNVANGSEGAGVPPLLGPRGDPWLLLREGREPWSAPATTVGATDLSGLL